jgi:MFS family permease
MNPPNSSVRLFAAYGTAVLWNVCMGMVQVLVPLYALSLGFSVLKVSSVVAFPALAEILVRFLGGALSDRFGERRMLQVCYLLMACAGLALVSAETYLELMVAQGIAYFSRSTFWTSIQSLASQLPGASTGKKLGRISACNYGGGMVGLSVGGLASALLGFRNSFLLLTLLAFFCALLGLLLPHVEPKPLGRSVWRIGTGIARLLGYRRIWLVITVSYAAALPASLTQSIYPLYLAQLDYGDQWIGLMLSSRSVGPVLTGLLLGAVIAPARQKIIYAVGMGFLGLFLLGSGATGDPTFLTLCIAGLGAAGGIMDLLYLVEAAEQSKASDRSVAMASMGLGWNLSPVITPMAVGWLVEVYGFQLAFWATGGFFLLVAAGTRLWHRLLAPT